MKLPIFCKDCGKILGYIDEKVIYLYCKSCKVERPTLIERMIAKVKEILQ